MSESIKASDAAGASVARNEGHAEEVFARGFYQVDCYDAEGNLKWSDTVRNLVTNAGKADLLDKYLSGSSYTAVWYLGLVDGGSAPTYNAADTYTSHAGWTESTVYSNATRPAPNSWNAATSSGGGAGSAGTGSKATTATAFNINNTGTIAGVFLTTNATKGDSTAGAGKLIYSAGSFTGGNRSVANGDTLNVTYTAQA